MHKRALWLTAGICLCLLALELALRMLPVSTATRRDYYFDRALLTYPPHYIFTTSTGWNLQNAHTYRSNNYGFLDERDFKPNNNAVAIIGDSFVESNMLEPSDRLGPQLERLIGKQVYSMGSPGSSLLDYVERARFASEQWGIRDFVFVIERGDIWQAICGSGNVHALCLSRATAQIREERHSSASVAKRLISQSALAQYFVSQLKLDPKGFFVTIRDTEPRVAATKNSNTTMLVRDALIDQVINFFLARLGKLSPRTVVIVLDCDRAAIYGGKKLSQEPDLKHFTNSLKHTNYYLIDTKPVFEGFYNTTGLRLDVSPQDPHWNPTAHQLVAKKIALLFR